MRTLALLAAALLAAVPAEGAPRTTRFFADLPGDVIALSHGGLAPLGLAPPGIAALGDPANRRGLLLMLRLRDEAGAVVGTATETEILEDQPALIAKRETIWTIMLPDRGMLVGHETEALPPEHRAAVAAAMAGRTWTGRAEGQVATGPLPRGLGRILGGTGAFESTGGSLSEYFVLTKVAPGGVLEGRLELRLVEDVPAK